MVGLCVCRPFSSHLLSVAFNAGLGFNYDSTKVKIPAFLLWNRNSPWIFAILTILT